MTVTAQSEESDGDTADITTTLPVTFTGVADTPDVAAAPEQGAEDQGLPLKLSAAATDVDGSETITAAVISGIPAGFSLNVGTYNSADNTWTVPPAQLGNVVLTAPEHFSGTVNLGLTVTATDTGGDTETNTTNFTASFAAMADTPNLSAANASGNEDSPINLDLSSSLVDTDGSETLTVVISGVPDGATLSAGTDNGDATWTVNASDLGDLTLTPPLHFSGDIPLTVTATSTEQTRPTASTSANFNVHVTGVADAPGLTAELVTTPEDANMGLKIAGTLVDTDSSESLSYTVAGVPDGFSLTDGTFDSATNTWSLTPDQLDDLQLVPPADWSGQVDLTVTASTTEADGDTTSVSSDISGTFVPVADAPLATAQNLNGDEDSFIPFQGFSSAETDVDGSETLSAMITGVPLGARS